MKKLPYFVRRKLRNRFTQLDLLEPKKFVEFLRKHGIHIGEKTLEQFEKDGVLQPILRIKMPKKDQKSLFIPNVPDLKWYYSQKQVEFPKTGDYQPWKKFRANYQKTGNLIGSKLHFYHPFQILQVENILSLEKFYFIYSDSYSDNDLQKILKNIKSKKRRFKKFIHTAPIGQEDKIGLLMLLEEPYRFHAFGQMSFSGFESNRTFDSWVRWMNTRFDSNKLLKESGLTIDDVRHLYQYLARKAIREDPLSSWYDLTRIMRIEMLKRLQGDALKSQLYYNLCRLLAFFLYDLTGEVVEEPDIMIDGRHGEWKTQVISEPFDYSTKKTQQGIIRYYVRETKTRIFILVEGETEMEVIKKICESLNIDLAEDGINLVNYNGIENLKPRKLQQTIHVANRDNIPVFIIADNESNASAKINNIKREIISKFDHYIWNESFEMDNFGLTKVLKLVNKYLKKDNKKLLKKEISKYQKKRSLIRSIELAYRYKYHDDIYKKIPRKPALSLELMKYNLRKISKKKELGTTSPIEKIMKRVFGLHAQWTAG